MMLSLRPTPALAIVAMVLACVGCQRQQAPQAAVAVAAPAKPLPVAAPVVASATVATTKIWFSCKATESAVDFVATEPGADHAFTLEKRERVTGKVMEQYALTEGEGDAGAGHAFTPFLRDGKEFGALRSVNGNLLDPPVEGFVPSELRIGDNAVACAPPVADAPALKLSAAAILGTWSFDGSCASGDGMILRFDGTASLGEEDEGGEGGWMIVGDDRLAISVQLREMGDENAKPEQLEYSLHVTQLTANRLAGTLTDKQGKRPARPIDARRCANKI